MKNVFLFLSILIWLFSSCNKDEAQSYQIEINNSVRSEINKGLISCSTSDQKLFYQKYTDLKTECDEYSARSNPDVYMKSDAYIAFKNFIIESDNPAIYCLYIDQYLKDVNGLYCWFFTDIMNVKYGYVLEAVQQQFAEQSTLVEQTGNEFWAEYIAQLVEAITG